LVVIFCGATWPCTVDNKTRCKNRKLLQNEVNSKTGTVTSPKCLWILAPWGPQQYLPNSTAFFKSWDKLNITIQKVTFLVSLLFLVRGAATPIPANKMHFHQYAIKFQARGEYALLGLSADND